jgi:putative mRNA 3-end processing factor
LIHRSEYKFSALAAKLLFVIKIRLTWVSRMATTLLELGSKGISCPRAGVYIDPWESVDRAVITHIHSDHARPGCGQYLIHHDSAVMLQHRLGNVSFQSVGYGEQVIINGVSISLHPAGHMLGSAQVRVEYNGEVWCVSGDYKLQDDTFSAAFEPVRCNVFITESTFGLPVYKWLPQQSVYEEIALWWKENRMLGKASVLTGYALGKMQRLIANVLPLAGENFGDAAVFAHGAVFNINEKLRSAGFRLPYVAYAGSASKAELAGALVLAPPLAARSSWLKRFEPFSLGHCSGWMAVRGAKNRSAVDRGFVLSDHADWSGLNETVIATGAERVLVTHGFTDVFARWLNEKGIEAQEVKTRYGDEQLEQAEGAAV